MRWSIVTTPIGYPATQSVHGGGVGAKLLFSRVTLGCKRHHDIADAPLERFRQLSQFLNARLLAGLRGEDRGGRGPAGLLDGVQAVFLLDVANLVRQHGGQLVLSLAALNHATCHEDQAAGAAKAMTSSESISRNDSRDVSGRPEKTTSDWPSRFK